MKNVSAGNCFNLVLCSLEGCAKMPSLQTFDITEKLDCCQRVWWPDSKSSRYLRFFVHEHPLTRKHSSRMCTVHLLTVGGCPGVCPEGVQGVCVCVLEVCVSRGMCCPWTQRKTPPDPKADISPHPTPF